MKKEEARPVRVLLVDDNVHGLTARNMILLDHGYEVETAQSGEEAWEIFQIHHFDVVVTDLRMSGIDGVELIRRIRESGSPARFILLSGFVGCLALTEKSTGADEVIAKSNKEVPELLRAIGKLSVTPRRKPPANAGPSRGGSSRRRTG
jgi:CheY-like chemotaxis protein